MGINDDLTPEERAISRGPYLDELDAWSVEEMAGGGTYEEPDVHPLAHLTPLDDDSLIKFVLKNKRPVAVYEYRGVRGLGYVGVTLYDDIHNDQYEAIITEGLGPRHYRAIRYEEYVHDHIQENLHCASEPEFRQLAEYIGFPLEPLPPKEEEPTTSR